MNKMQIAVLGISVVAFGAAYMLFNSFQTQAPAPAPIVQVAPKIATDEVLVASQDVPMGTLISENAVNWQEWPKAAISDMMISDFPVQHSN